MANKERHLCNSCRAVLWSAAVRVFTGDALKAELRAGDFVVSSREGLQWYLKWKTSLQVAQLVSAAGIAIQVARGFTEPGEV